MKKRTMLLIVISLVLAFGLAVPAAADAPETMTCFIPWFYSDGTYFEFEAEGQLVPNGQGFNFNCPYTFDFSDPAIASIEQACAYLESYGFPDFCNGNGKNFQWKYWFGFFVLYNGEVYSVPQTSLQVLSTGAATMHGQYAPGQCSDGAWSYSYTLEFPAGFWSPGQHEYTMYYLDINGYSESFTNTFTVDPGAPIVKGQVRFGPFDVAPTDVINPAQDTFMQFTSIFGRNIISVLLPYIDGDLYLFSWDGREPVQIMPGPLTSFCGAVPPNAYLLRNHGYAK